jgi:hypothetical protein
MSIDHLLPPDVVVLKKAMAARETTPFGAAANALQGVRGRNGPEAHITEMFWRASDAFARGEFPGDGSGPQELDGLSFAQLLKLPGYPVHRVTITITEEKGQ